MQSTKKIESRLLSFNFFIQQKNNVNREIMLTSGFNLKHMSQYRVRNRMSFGTKIIRLSFLLIMVIALFLLVDRLFRLGYLELFY